jgi:hypothetical protein
LRRVIYPRIVRVLRRRGDNPMKKLSMSLHLTNSNKPYTSRKDRDTGLFVRGEKHGLAMAFR